MFHYATAQSFIQRKGLLFYAVLFCCVCCRVSLSHAEQKTWLPKSVQIHGFLSQGFIHTTANNFFGKSDDSVSPDYRELGINGSWNPLPDLQMALQLTYRNAGKTDNLGLRVDYGLVSYNLFSSESSLLTLRAGRVPNPLGFYNETRDVAATRPTILLPQSVYFSINRNLSLSSDGGYLYGEHRTEYGDFSLNVGLASPRMRDPDLKYRFLGNSPGQLQGDLSWISRLGYEWRGGLVKLGISYANIRSNIESYAGPNTVSGKWQFSPVIFSAQYNAENWSLTSEYELRPVKFRGLGSLGIPNTSYTGRSFYLQGTYHLTRSLEGIARYDSLIWNVNDKYGYKYEQQTGAPNYSQFAEDWTFGLRYEIVPSLLLSAEYHHINGTGWISPLENPPGTTKQHWDMYLMMMSYNF